MEKGYFLRIFLMCIYLVDCTSKTEQPFQLPQNARTLLTADSVKTWKLARRINNSTRMNMGHCFLEYRQTYYVDQLMHDNAGENWGCGETLDAQWHFTYDKSGQYYVKLVSDQLPKLMKLSDNFKHFKVLDLRKDQMVLQYRHQQFSGKASTITDVWVPEGLNISDREFHW
ncbi:MAG: hypothetical protein AAGC88_04105 [Bacteroidota bacterium]